MTGIRFAQAMLGRFVALAALPAAASAQTLTPRGPATLKIGYEGAWACPAMAPGSSVMVGWQAQVGAGGEAGTVRPVFGDVVGDPVTLPAEPGTYSFPAPHISPPGCLSEMGLSQETGGHAIVVSEQAASANRYIVVGRAGQSDERIALSHLAITPVVEPDVDGDRVGDHTEDRTDLTLAAAPVRDAIGRLRVAVTITNAGPLPADRPVLTATKRRGRWEGACDQRVISVNQCFLEPLAVGESRMVTFYDDAPATPDAGFTLVSEGPDLNWLNNQALHVFGGSQAFGVSVAPKQRLQGGVRLTVFPLRPSAPASRSPSEAAARRSR